MLKPTSRERKLTNPWKEGTLIMEEEKKIKPNA